jgi:hypothetical protein
MEREQLKELHYITHVDNVPSICATGVLSHRRAARVGHKSIADEEVQNRRRGRRVPGGLLLHDYANLYVTARNAMLFRRIEDGWIDDLCVLRISTDVLDLEGVVVTDRNAAKFGCSFKSPSEGIEGVDLDLLNRQYWNDGDALESERCQNTKFTEVLIPHRVPPEHLQGMHVGTDPALAKLPSGLPISATKNTYLFFDRS